MEAELSVRRLVGSLALLVALVGCSSSQKHTSNGAASTNTPSRSSNTAGASPVNVTGTFGAYKDPSTVAVTYDAAQVPVGAIAKVTATAAGASTQITLHVSGLQPRRAYGAHMHNKSCGAKAADAGSHYQHAKDPRQPSTNPQFANPQNEVWLDLSTDANGAADSTTTVPWAFRVGAEGPHSVVIHATHTNTTAGKAGTAGARLACITVAH
jgi:Cu-Zn family superoxide dismutase